MSNMVDFYHYTSEASVDLIINSGMIRESPDGGADAMLGPGVYGTAVTPAAGKRAIANNNWAKGWQTRERGGHVDYVFKIRIPRQSVLEYNVGTRHIYLHKGAIVLGTYEWECYEV
ncbi:uncharacterized protein [Littorina saxatilis]|uniref:Uncharacterized protein n=1 Tax=Littorina saxatilis TaxID=31220 RepID=A0AAN9BX36_9CAEN